MTNDLTYILSARPSTSTAQRLFKLDTSFSRFSGHFLASFLKGVKCRVPGQIHVHRSQKRSDAIFLKLSTSEQHTATVLVNLVHFLPPVSPDHTDFVREFEQDG